MVTEFPSRKGNVLKIQRDGKCPFHPLVGNEVYFSLNTMSITLYYILIIKI